MEKISCVVAGGDRLGESPVWSVREQCLYWVDSRAPAVFRLDHATGRVERRGLPRIVGSVCLRARGGLIVAMQDGLHAYDFQAGILVKLTDPECHLPENRFNDGRCDRRGRFWVGTMSDVRRDPTGTLYRFDPDHSITTQLDDIIVPNSICWSPDDRFMYFADTYRDRIMRFDFDIDAGTISNPVQIVDTTGKPGRPDGSTVDAEGYLWNARYGSGCVVRHTSDGAVDRVIELPVSQPTSCSFGGPDLSTLYITTANQRLSGEELARQPLAGAVFAVATGIRGLPEPEFAG